MGAVSFTDPASGSLIANFEGTENATTITCNVTNSQGNQITTLWTLANFRNIPSLQTINAAPELFEITGDPIAGTIFTFNDRLTVLNLVRGLDHVTIFCGTGGLLQQANFFLRIYRKFKIQSLPNPVCLY
jgi:N-acetylglucosamine kinase-like BadF-type ATPase